MRNNQLSSKNRWLLYNFMGENKHIAEKRTDRQNAKWVTEILGFFVSEQNIASARKDLEWSPRRVKIDSPLTLKQLDSRMAAIENWLDSNFPNWSE
jgi:hypothetical protein